MSRLYSAKARGYMQTYMHKYMKEKDSANDNVTEWSFEKNEKIHKIYRSHRDANTTDGAFIEKVMRECICMEI